jgi:hypothetical protein
MLSPHKTIDDMAASLGCAGSSVVMPSASFMAVSRAKSQPLGQASRKMVTDRVTPRLETPPENLSPGAFPLVAGAGFEPATSGL